MLDRCELLEVPCIPDVFFGKSKSVFLSVGFYQIIRAFIYLNLKRLNTYIDALLIYFIGLQASIIDRKSQFQSRMSELLIKLMQSWKTEFKFETVLTFLFDLKNI